MTPFFIFSNTNNFFLLYNYANIFFFLMYTNDESLFFALFLVFYTLICDYTFTNILSLYKGLARSRSTSFFCTLQCHYPRAWLSCSSVSLFHVIISFIITISGNGVGIRWDRSDSFFADWWLLCLRIFVLFVYTLNSFFLYYFSQLFIYMFICLMINGLHALAWLWVVAINNSLSALWINGFLKKRTLLLISH